MTRIYNYSPTKEEKEKCKNGCYLIDGELVPIVYNSLTN